MRVSEFRTILRNEHPDIWRALHPRTYAGATGWCRVRNGDSISVPGRWVPFEWPVQSEGFLVFAGACPTDDHHDAFIISCRPDGTFDTGNVITAGHPSRFHYGEIVGTTTGLLLAMSARPELVERDGRRVRTIKAGPAREEWTPNWVGRTYRLRRADGDGTHAAPRLHWRRGHFRQQPHGVGGKDRKTIWLEPVLVGAA